MGICNRADIFQEKISELFKGFDTVRSYIYDILVITKKYFKNHINSLEKVLHKLEESELNLNTEKSFFGRTETEHLSLWVGNQGVRLLLTEIRKVFLFLFSPSLYLY